MESAIFRWSQRYRTLRSRWPQGHWSTDRRPAAGAPGCTRSPVRWVVFFFGSKKAAKNILTLCKGSFRLVQNSPLFVGLMGCPANVSLQFGVAGLGVLSVTSLLTNAHFTPMEKGYHTFKAPQNWNPSKPGPCQESQVLVVPAPLAEVADPLCSSVPTSFVHRWSTLPLVLVIKWSSNPRVWNHLSLQNTTHSMKCSSHFANFPHLGKAPMLAAYISQVLSLPSSLDLFRWSPQKLPMSLPSLVGAPAVATVVPPLSEPTTSFWKIAWKDSDKYGLRQHSLNRQWLSTNVETFGKIEFSACGLVFWIETNVSQKLFVS